MNIRIDHNPLFMAVEKVKLEVRRKLLHDRIYMIVEQTEPFRKGSSSPERPGQKDRRGLSPCVLLIAVSIRNEEVHVVYM